MACSISMPPSTHHHIIRAHHSDWNHRRINISNPHRLTRRVHPAPTPQPTSRQLQLRQSAHHPAPPHASASAVELSQKSEFYAPRDVYDRTHRLAASSNRAQPDATRHSPNSPSLLLHQTGSRPSSQQRPAPGRFESRRDANELGHSDVWMSQWTHLLDAIDHRVPDRQAEMSNTR